MVCVCTVYVLSEFKIFEFQTQLRVLRLYSALRNTLQFDNDERTFPIDQFADNAHHIRRNTQFAVYEVS